LPEGRAEELDEAGAGELVAVSAFELAIVKKEIAGDAHAQGHLASRTPGYLDSFVRCLVFGTYGYLDSIGFVVGTAGYLDTGGFIVGTRGYLDSGALIARALARGSVGLIGSGALVAFIVVGGFVAFG
jgi:hypothetical protein